MNVVKEAEAGAQEWLPSSAWQTSYLSMCIGYKAHPLFQGLGLQLFYWDTVMEHLLHKFIMDGISKLNITIFCTYLHQIFLLKQSIKRGLEGCHKG